MIGDYAGFDHQEIGFMETTLKPALFMVYSLQKVIWPSVNEPASAYTPTSFWIIQIVNTGISS